MRYKTRARVQRHNIDPFAICDRCEARVNHSDLSWQLEYAGANPVSTGFLVCSRCLDRPHPQLKSRTIPPNPVPIKHPRPGYTIQTPQQITTELLVPIDTDDGRDIVTDGKI